MKLINFKINSEYKNLKGLNLVFSQKSSTSVLIGNNGAGKTNILEAISYVFSQLYKQEKDFKFLFSLTYKMGSQTYKIQYDKKKEDNTENVLLLKKKDGSGYTTISFADLEIPKRIICNYSGEDTRLWESVYSSHYADYLDEIRGKRTGYGNQLKMIYVNKDCWPIILLIMLIKRNENDTFKKFISDVLGINDEISIKLDLTPEAKKWTETNRITLYLKALQASFKNESSFSTTTPEDFNPNDNSDYELFLYLTALKEVTNKLSVSIKRGIESSALSEGETKLMVVQFILESLADESSLVLLDEPDSHVHVTRKQELAKLFLDTANRNNLITSHSPTLTALFSSSDKEAIIMLRKNETGSVTTIPKEERDLVEEITGNFWSSFQRNIFLATNKDIMLVEGESDVVFINKALENFHKQSKYLDLSFEFLPCGGAASVKLFHQKFRPKDNQSIFAFFDADEAGRRGMGEIIKSSSGNGKEWKLEEFGKARKKDHVWFSFYLPYRNRKDCENFNVEDYFTLKHLKKLLSSCSSLATVRDKNYVKKTLLEKCRDDQLTSNYFDKFATLFDLIEEMKKADERGEIEIPFPRTKVHKKSSKSKASIKQEQKKADLIK